ncbi:MAG: B12-binding domain-containing radical SAM protein [Candidatus Anammoximicrobium sp.]|nr:B12-binding domain-containing radical SAM protein [Candidatus Anammoximicrobium sp.]
MNDGFPIVLTADRTLTADYRLLFDGMLAASQTTSAPPALLEWLLMPRGRRAGGRTKVAPLGLRRIEAALLAGGFSPEEVAVVSEEQLAAAIGRRTRVIGVSSGEPAGLGMNSSTMTTIGGGRSYPEAMFGRLMRCIHRLNRDVSAKVVLGGPGAWQIADDPRKCQELGIDHVVSGYAEENAAAVFRSLLREEPVPRVVTGGWNPAVTIPPIRGASTMGVVEISRGCGLGCSFCTIGRVPMTHLPLQTIAADVETNLASGISHVALLSEDFFRYGGIGGKANPDSLLALVRQIRQIPQVGFIQIDHASMASVAQYEDSQLLAIHDLLAGENTQRYVWVNIGVETASDRLLEQIGAAAKCKRSGSEPWGDFCRRQLRRLCQARYFPLASLIVGVPGERDEDLQETLRWVESLADQRLAVFPVLYAPVDGGPPLDASRLRPLHWALIRACYRLNFRWVPWLYRDQQTAAGVPRLRRLTLQLLGYGQVLQWKSLLAWHHWRARRRP